MAAEAKNDTKPAIERADPVVNNITEALDDVACYIERLRVLHSTNLGELQELSETVDANRARPIFGSRLYDAWIIFIIVGEMLANVDALVAAINLKAHSDRRAVRA